MQSSAWARSSKLRSDGEVAGMEFVGGTDLGRDRDWLMEHGHGGRRESGSELASA
jgi:hypothetical protein